MKGRYRHRLAPLQSQGYTILHWTEALQRRDGVQRHALSGRIFHLPIHNPEEQRQWGIYWKRPHRPPPRESSGGHALQSGIPITTRSHRRDAYLKLQKKNQVATYPRGRHHGYHQNPRSSSRPVDQFHQSGNQRTLPMCRRGHGSPPETGGLIQHMPGGEVAEQYDALLPPHNGKELHRGPIGQDVRTWRLRAHSDGAHRQLVPRITQGPSRPLIQVFSGDFIQD